MAKWADYLVSKVRYNEEHQHIDQIKVHEDDGSENVTASTIWNRNDLILKIKKGNKAVTIYKDENGSYKKGDTIEVVSIENHEYIKTVGDKIKKDNLGELPEF